MNFPPEMNYALHKSPLDYSDTIRSFMIPIRSNVYNTKSQCVMDSSSEAFQRNNNIATTSSFALALRTLAKNAIDEGKSNSQKPLSSSSLCELREGFNTREHPQLKSTSQSCMTDIGFTPYMASTLGEQMQKSRSSSFHEAYISAYTSALYSTSSYSSPANVDAMYQAHLNRVRALNSLESQICKPFTGSSSETQIRCQKQKKAKDEILRHKQSFEETKEGKKDCHLESIPQKRLFVRPFEDDYKPSSVVSSLNVPSHKNKKRIQNIPRATSKSLNKENHNHKDNYTNEDNDSDYESLASDSSCRKDGLKVKTTEENDKEEEEMILRIPSPKLPLPSTPPHLNNMTESHAKTMYMNAIGLLRLSEDERKEREEIWSVILDDRLVRKSIDTTIHYLVRLRAMSSSKGNKRNWNGALLNPNIQSCKSVSSSSCLSSSSSSISPCKENDKSDVISCSSQTLQSSKISWPGIDAVIDAYRKYNNDCQKELKNLSSQTLPKLQKEVMDKRSVVNLLSSKMSTLVRTQNSFQNKERSLKTSIQSLSVILLKLKTLAETL